METQDAVVRNVVIEVLH